MNNYLKLQKNISIGNLMTAICIVFYRLSLDYIYINYISIKWNYTGFDLAYSSSNLIISWISLVICMLVISKNIKNQKTSNYIIQLLNLIAFIPATTLMAYTPTDNKFILLLLGYWIMLNTFNYIVPYFTLPRLIMKTSSMLFNLLVALFTITVLFVSFYYTKFRISLDLFSVYDLRSEALEFNIPTILNYLFSASRVIMPTIMIYKLSKKKYLQFCFFLYLGILIYSVNGQRSVLFSVLLTILGYFFYKNKFSQYFALSLLTINLSALIEILIKNSSLIIDIFIRRVLFVPQLLNYNYYDFFMRNEYDYFRQSIFNKFGLSSPYNINITILIGSLYQGGNANNGLFSDAYYNLGGIGIIIMPLLIILALRLLDAATQGLDNKILVASIISITFNFISSSFFTILLTHGYLALCIILYLMPRDSVEMLKKSNRYY